MAALCSTVSRTAVVSSSFRGTARCPPRAVLARRPQQQQQQQLLEQQQQRWSRPSARGTVVAFSGSDAPADQTKGTSSAFDFEEPETAREAIDLGLVLCKQDRWAQALPIFQKAVTLPGTGVKRFRDKPRAASDGEKMAALYNTACCHARLGEPREGLLALSACLEAGYADFDQIIRDPDLELLRQDPRFTPLVQRFQPRSGGFLGIKLPW